jgi:SAM-dependent methyltransferase
MPTDSRSQSEYHQRLYHRLLSADEVPTTVAGLDQMGHLGDAGCQRIADAVAAALPSGPLRILELGCGVGGALRAVTRLLGSRVRLAVGVDLLSRMVVAGCRWNRGERLLAADAGWLPFREGTFDVVFAAGSFSHMADPVSVLAEAADACADDGVIVVLDEVGTAGGIPPEGFCATHPDGVFVRRTPDERRADLTAAGLAPMHLVDLGDWAVRQLRLRVRAMRLYRPRLIEFYGEPETDAIVATVIEAADAVAAGHVRPTEIVARPAGRRAPAASGKGTVNGS